MFDILLATHHYLRHILLLLLVLSILKSLTGWFTKSNFQSIDNKISLWLMISAHVQLLLGLILYFMSPNVQFSSEAMHDKMLRYWTAEHIAMMIIAIAFITIGRISSKKANSDVSKFQRLAIYNILGIVVVLVSLIKSSRGII